MEKLDICFHIRYPNQTASEGAESAAEIGTKAASTADESVTKAKRGRSPKAGSKAAENILAREAGENVAEVGAKSAGKKSLKSIVGKIIGPRIAKVVGKSIPFVGALAGLGFGIARAMEGDFKGAGAEVAGGIASTFPGAGTAVSVATDVGLLARDVYKEAYEVFPENDPLSESRIGEVQKEVSDYMDSFINPGEAQSSNIAPGTSGASAAGDGTAEAAQTAAGQISTPQVTSGGVSGGVNIIPAAGERSDIGFNQRSAQLALANNTTPPPVIINNNNTAAGGGAGGGGGGGGSTARTSGSVRTSPNQSHIDRALYGDLYNAGIP